MPHYNSSIRLLPSKTSSELNKQLYNTKEEIIRVMCIKSAYNDERIVNGVWYDGRILRYGMNSLEFVIWIKSDGPEFGINYQTYVDNFITVDEYRDMKIALLDI